jgi:hypothetical protein
VIASLLSQSLVVLEEDYALTSYDDAIFEDFFIVSHGGDTDEGFLQTMSVLFLDMDLFLVEELLHHRGSPQPSAKPDEAVLLLKEIISKIFIPPKVVS